jgi:hypothetical protein
MNTQHTETISNPAGFFSSLAPRPNDVLSGAQAYELKICEYCGGTFLRIAGFPALGNPNKYCASCKGQLLRHAPTLSDRRLAASDSHTESLNRAWTRGTAEAEHRRSESLVEMALAEEVDDLPLPVSKRLSGIRWNGDGADGVATPGRLARRVVRGSDRAVRAKSGGKSKPADVATCKRKKAFATAALARGVARQSRRAHKGAKVPVQAYRCRVRVAGDEARSKVHYHIGGNHEIGWA